MSEIKRYWWNDDWMLQKKTTGELVKYDDHTAAMAAKDARHTALYRAASALIDMIDADADFHRLDETHAYRELRAELERSE